MGHRENILLISLGRSPAVIPETLDALLENNIFIKRTYIVTTSDDTILNECIPLILQDFEKYYKPKNMELKAWQCILSSDDIYTERDNLNLMINVAKLFKKEKGNNIYISMAGGRKTMSAAMALLAQIYSARAITHVLVSEEIEKSGNIYTLKNLNQNQIEAIFHPKEKRLIFFPVIGVSWMLTDMIKALQGDEVQNLRKDVREILIENGLLDENSKPTPLGRLLYKLINDIEKFPEPSLNEPYLKFKKNEPNTPKGYKKFVMRLSYVPFIEKIIGLKFINSSETRINDITPEGIIICQYSDGNLAYVLKLLTTARTKGETEMVRKYIKKSFNIISSQK